jgi:hypothetical protein
MTGYVYFISDGAATKIGIATSPRQRLNDLQTGHPRRLKLVHAIETNNPRRLEKWLHDKYAASRLAGEWLPVALCSVIKYKQGRYLKARLTEKNGHRRDVHIGTISPIYRKWETQS